MNETAFETIASAASALKLDFSSEEFAGFAEDNGLSEAAIEAVKKVFSYLREKKQQNNRLHKLGCLILTPYWQESFRKVAPLTVLVRILLAAKRSATLRP